VDCLRAFLDLAAGTPPERDARHFRTWQKVSVQAQREVRSFVARSFFADEARVAAKLNRAFLIVVYSSCQPCYGRPQLDFTYDMSDLGWMTTVLRFIGRPLQARLAEVSAGLRTNERLRRRFAPVWHVDILNTVKKRPQALLELLAREAAMVNALIELGIRRNARAQNKLSKTTDCAARALGVDSNALLDQILKTGAENLVDGRILKRGDALPPRRPDARIGGHENRDHRSPHGGGQMADPGIVSDVQLCC
jgi:hypothetical protein